MCVGDRIKLLKLPFKLLRGESAPCPSVSPSLILMIVFNGKFYQNHLVFSTAQIQIYGVVLTKSQERSCHTKVKTQLAQLIFPFFSL